MGGICRFDAHALTTSAAALTAASRDLSRSAAMAAAAADDISIASSKSLEVKGSFTWVLWTCIVQIRPVCRCDE